MVGKRLQFHVQPWFNFRNYLQRIPTKAGSSLTRWLFQSPPQMAFKLELSSVFLWNYQRFFFYVIESYQILAVCVLGWNNFKKYFFNLFWENFQEWDSLFALKQGALILGPCMLRSVLSKSWWFGNFSRRYYVSGCFRLLLRFVFAHTKNLLINPGWDFTMTLNVFPLHILWCAEEQ